MLESGAINSCACSIIVIVFSGAATFMQRGYNLIKRGSCSKQRAAVISGGAAVVSGGAMVKVTWLTCKITGQLLHAGDYCFKERESTVLLSDAAGLLIYKVEL